MEQSERYMREALGEAQKAAALGEVPVGAVLVIDGRVAARAHNLVETNQDATQHAEMIVLREAARAAGGWRLTDAALYVTLEPCPMCLGAILLSRVAELYYGADDPVQGACGSVFDFSNHPGLPGATRVYPHILADSCTDLLKDFFRRRRKPV